MVRKLKPQAYLDEFYPSSGMCTKTIINWIKTEKIVGEKTYTGRYLVLIDSSESQSRIDSGKQPSQVSNLVQMIKGQVM